MLSKTLIVVGMHRSGTSLVTNWLNKCGLQVGNSLMEGAPSNKEGHFEDLEFVRAHEEIFVSNHLPPSGLIDNKVINVSAYQKGKLKNIIKSNNKLYTQWGWKDPRTCLFLDTYRELIPEAKYLVIVRDYQSVVSSLLKRDFFDLDRKYDHRGFITKKIWAWFRRNRSRETIFSSMAEHYLKVWVAYTNHILIMVKTLTQNDFIVVNYILLGKCDKQIFSHLAEDWDFDLKFVPFKKVFKENLLNKPDNLTPYIKNSKLVAEAESLENAFKPYIRAC